jgi:hypothetical protein
VLFSERKALFDGFEVWEFARFVMRHPEADQPRAPLPEERKTGSSPDSDEQGRRRAKILIELYQKQAYSGTCERDVARNSERGDFSRARTRPSASRK